MAASTTTEQSRNPIFTLYHQILSLFETVLKGINSSGTWTENERSIIKTCLAQLILWGHDTCDEKLDQIVSQSPLLQRSILEVLSALATTLLAVQTDSLTDTADFKDDQKTLVSDLQSTLNEVQQLLIELESGGSSTVSDPILESNESTASPAKLFVGKIEHCTKSLLFTGPTVDTIVSRWLNARDTELQDSAEVIPIGEQDDLGTEIELLMSFNQETLVEAVPEAVPEADSEFESVDSSSFLPSDIKSEEPIIAVIGPKGAGKSSFISNFTDPKVYGEQNIKALDQRRELSFSRRHGMSSTYQQPNFRSYRCSLEHDKWPTFWFVDTPAMDDEESSGGGVIQGLANWLAEYHFQNAKLTGVVYLHPLTSPQVPITTTSFIEGLRKLMADKIPVTVIVATTHWDLQEQELNRSRQSRIHSCLSRGKVAKEGWKTCRHDQGRRSSRGILYSFYERNQVLLSTKALPGELQKTEQQPRSFVSTETGTNLVFESLSFCKTISREADFLLEKAARTAGKMPILHQSLDSRSRELTSLKLSLRILQNDIEERSKFNVGLLDTKSVEALLSDIELDLPGLENPSRVQQFRELADSDNLGGVLVFNGYIQELRKQNDMLRNIINPK